MHAREPQALDRNPSNSAHLEGVQGGFFSMKKPLEGRASGYTCSDSAVTCGRTCGSTCGSTCGWARIRGKVAEICRFRARPSRFSICGTLRVPCCVPCWRPKASCG